MNVYSEKNGGEKERENWPEYIAAQGWIITHHHKGSNGMLHHDNSYESLALIVTRKIVMPQ